MPSFKAVDGVGGEETRGKCQVAVCQYVGTSVRRCGMAAAVKDTLFRSLRVFAIFGAKDSLWSALCGEYVSGATFQVSLRLRDSVREYSSSCAS